MDWSNKMARAETDLRRAVLVTMLCSGPSSVTVDVDTAKAAVAGAFNLDINTLVLRRSHLEGVFIPLAADEATASRLIRTNPWLW